MVIIGSARHDERGKLTGGKAGDNTQVGIDDYKGEVSMQNFYVHKFGWYILRPKKVAHGQALGASMKKACNNPMIGYDQNQRLGVVQNGINTQKPTEGDCGTTVRACVIDALGVDPGNFTTANEVKVLMATGLFEKLSYKKGMPLYTGDVLVSKLKGHTAIVTSGDTRPATGGAVAFGSFVCNGVDYSHVFNPTYYYNRYGDLRSAIGNSPSALFNHFIQHGMNEGRIAIDTFNVNAYKANNPDLMKAFGSLLPEYYKHYCVYGYKENRKTV